jgi:hypothetical protein
LNAPAARSSIGGHFFLGWSPQDHLPIKLNGAIHVISTILKFVAASAAEAELGALFVNAKEGRIIRLILHELGHPQPPTPICYDNSTAAGIANNTIKRQRSRSMEMCYFWIADQVASKQFAVHWHPGLENMGDYYTKHTQQRTISTSAPTTCTSQPAHWNFRGYQHRKSCEGVLKPRICLPTDPGISLPATPAGTYGTC